MSKPWFVLIESNSTGTGPAFAKAVQRLNWEPLVLAENPERYPWLKQYGISYQTDSTRDERQLQQTIGRLLPQGVVGVYSSSEYYVEIASRVAEHFGLPGARPNAVAICRNKHRARQRLRQHGIPVPMFACVKSETEARKAIEESSLPVIVKPTTGSGSFGVRLCSTAAEAMAHAVALMEQLENERGLPLPQEALIEEYINGPEFSVETFNGALVGVTRKHLSPEPDFVEIGHDFPAPVSDRMSAELCETALRALSATDLRWGPAHTEVRFTPRGPYIIEINPRLAGGFIPELVRLATGFDSITATVELAAGRQVLACPRAHAFASIRFVMSPGDGELADVGGIEDAQNTRNVVEVTMYCRTGAPVRLRSDFRDRIGHVIAVADSEEEASSSAEQGLRKILLRVIAEPGPIVQHVATIA